MVTNRQGRAEKETIDILKKYLRAVYTRFFCVRFSVRDGAAAKLLCLRDHIRDHAREKPRKQFGSGAITDGETDAKNASVDGPLMVLLLKSSADSSDASARRRTTALPTIVSRVLCIGYVVNKTVSCVHMNGILVSIIK
jgi:hypothetical protein